MPPLHSVPQAQTGYCCEEGKVFPTTSAGCGGNLYNTQAEANRQCRTVTKGYCCTNGQVFPGVREECRGSFFTDAASARKACTAPPEQGYCCSGGRVSQSTRDRCSGLFSRSQDEAQRLCKRRSEIDVEKGVAKKPRGDDAPR